MIMKVTLTIMVMIIPIRNIVLFLILLIMNIESRVIIGVMGGVVEDVRDKTRGRMIHSY